MLATDIVSYLNRRPEFDVVALDHGALDITRKGEVDAAIAAHGPDIVINTAALHVDDCEADPEKAYAVNAWGTRVLARACERTGTTLVHISTGGLFGDEVKAYDEYSPVVLKTTYASSKYEGEQFAQSLCERHFVLRLGWLYGGGSDHRRNFVLARYREGRQKPVVQSASDKHGCPTYAGDVSALIPPLLDSREYGLYHVANQGSCTRARYVRQIFHEMGLSTRVEDVDSSRFPRSADLPGCEIITSLNLGYAGLDLLPPWEDALARYVDSIKDRLA